MAGKRERAEEMATTFWQVEVLQGQGATIASAVRQIGLLYPWRKRNGAMQRSQLARSKERGKKNQRCHRAVSDLTLDKLIMSEAAKDEWRQASQPADALSP